MTFTAPLWLGLAGLVAAGLIVAHLISTSVPQRDPFPTARFVPEGAPLTVLRTRRLTDIALLLLRLLAVALLGLALAGARVAKGGPTRVVLADRSRAVASPGEVSDSTAALAGDAVVLLSFDSVARREERGEIRDPNTAVRGSISAALVAAHGAMSDVTKGRERTELVLVSPLVREEVDSATAALLQLWEGPVRLVRVEAAATPASRFAVRATGDDPVAAALAQGADRSAGPGGEGFRSRVVRSLPTSADSMWARDSGGALVVWPADLSGPALQRRKQVDTTMGVAAGADVVVESFERTHEPRGTHVMAHWLDGSPAAAEASFGRGCIREVAIPVDPIGDLPLRENFRDLARALAVPCGGSRDYARVELDQLLAGRTEGGERPLDTPTPGADQPSREAVSLALLVLALLVTEQFLRRRARVA